MQLFPQLFTLEASHEMKRTAFALITLILLHVRLAAEQVEFRLTGNAGDGLLPGNVTPPTASDGSGGIGLTGILFDLDTNFLYLDFGGDRKRIQRFDR